MHPYRRHAVAAGLLFIAATFLGLLGNAIVRPFLATPLDLARIAADPLPLQLAFILKLAGFAACPGIALALYPVLRAHGAALALGSVAFRVLEAVFYTAGAAGSLVLVIVAQQAVAAGPGGGTVQRDLATLIPAVSEWLGFGAAVPFFAVGALLYYLAMYRGAVVPRWLSGWGIVAALLALAASALVLLGVIAPVTPVHMVLNLAIFLQELVLAGWLLVRGFAATVRTADAPIASVPVVAGSAS